MNYKIINLLLIGSIISSVILISCKKDDDNSSNNTDNDTSGNAPIASFIASQTNIDEETSINFTDNSTNTPTTWSWDFGDGGTSTEQNPSHTYSTKGSYSVSLTANNTYGSDTKTKTDYITVNISIYAPIANFTTNNTTVAKGDSIMFTDQSTNNPTSWSWDFGDGSSSTEQNPTHTYNTKGNYSVSLTANNTYGSNTNTKTDYITVNETGTYTDNRDGKIYKWVKIGDQVWMAENLAYTDSGQHIIDDSDWENNTDYDGWCYYNNDDNVTTYGVLYQWEIAITACPDGWHLPTDAEWTTLINYLEYSPGGKMKEIGTIHWNSPNTGANNSSGFTALPGGSRTSYGSFGLLSYSGYWWSATDGNSSNAFINRLDASNAEVYFTDYNKLSGLSVRCVRD